MELPDTGLFILRVTVGSVFVAHGYPKLFGGNGKTVSPVVARYLGQGFVQATERGGPANFAAVVARLGVPDPAAIAWFVALLEFFGGLMLAVGFLTRVVALLMSGEMAVAVGRVHWRNGLMGPGGFEFPLSLLGACLALVLTGPGRIAIDRSGDPT